MEVSLSEAARLTGTPRSRLYRLLESGHLERSGFLRGEAGAWRIEPGPREADGKTFAEWLTAMRGSQGPKPQKRQALPPLEQCQEPAAIGWWAEYGRIAGPDEPLLDRAGFWAHVSKIVAGMMGHGFEALLTAANTEELHRQLCDAIDEVQAGARWDQARMADQPPSFLIWTNTDINAHGNVGGHRIQGCNSGGSSEAPVF